MKKSAKKLILWGAAAAAGALGFTACRNKPETVYGPPSYFNPDPSENIPQDVYGPPPLEETETDDVTASETDAADDAAPSSEAQETASAGNAAPKDLNPAGNIIEAVYGPPPSFSNQYGMGMTGMDPGTEKDTAGKKEEESKGSPWERETAAEAETQSVKTEETAAETESEFDPSENIPEDVYGPPSWFGMPDEEPEESDPAQSEFDPAEEIPEAVYGPPEWWQDNESLGPEITYDPSVDIQPLVYGPPEYFEQNRDQGSEETIKQDTEEITTEENILYPVYGPPDSRK